MIDPAPLRVLDLTDELAWQGARMLVGLGADVLRVDRAAGLDPAARAHWHAGKRRVRLSETDSGRDDDHRSALDALAAEADVVLESGRFRALRGVLADGSSRWPHAVHVVVTPFGLTGPRREWLADDLVLAGAGGMAWLCGRPDGAPKAPPREQAVQTGGMHAAIAALLGVLARDRTGSGQLIDISACEAVAATLETGAIGWIHAGRYPVRTGGVYGHVAHRTFPAADGFVAGGYSGSDRMWTDLLSWLAEEGEAADLPDARYRDPVLRWEARVHVDEVIARFTAKRAAADLAAQGRARALPWAEVASCADLTTNPQLRDRRFFVTVTGDEQDAEDVGFAWEAPGLPRPVTLRALREVSRAAAWSSPGPRGRRTRLGKAGDPRPLAGVRVLDLTWVLAGPYATKMLAEHGADVIKIESRHRQDPTRFAPSMRLRPGAGPDDSGYFLNFNRGKRSVALNLRTGDGKRLLRELVPRCDVVIENFSPGVLARWGMDYDSLRAVNPDVVLVSMAGVGQAGPWRDAVTFADTLGAMSGLTHETAEPGGAPQGLAFGLGDMIAGNAAALAVLDMLARGSGGHVDLSQLEAMAAAMGPALLESVRPAGEPDPRTAEHPSRCANAVPHGVYRAAGTDRWIAISVLDDRAWRALAELIGATAELRDADQAERRVREDEIDALIAAWTADREPAALAGRLQAAGIPAALVATGQDLVEHDEQLAARGFYPVLEHPIAGPVRHEGVVARLTATPGALTGPAPLLGEHTAAVLGELLGLSEQDLAALAAAGVTE
ncbi:CoA transferase [Actinospica sp.]|jgi:crotonobetainyl-CoA:carnitine CoA-transferase CaiB-like acyl-CoA transferase|uniref:CaiB/BaiF CoA-transferase family protein n=1 Tax=Actinospica sp. TaxID=1872142 RepID=UPI002CF2DF19|nr:CoA transferase [Actinospica sp.]HWG26642.1 CoA transferase [Actinospica sp.]